MSGIPLTKELLKNKRHSVLHFVDIDDQDQVTIKDEVKSLIDGDEELTRYVQGIIRTIPTKDNPKLVPRPFLSLSPFLSSSLQMCSSQLIFQFNTSDWRRDVVLPSLFLRSTSLTSDINNLNSILAVVYICQSIHSCCQNSVFLSLAGHYSLNSARCLFQTKNQSEFSRFSSLCPFCASPKLVSLHFDFFDMLTQNVQLSDFHYEYKDGKLVNMTSGEAFHWVNQYHYDALGDIIVEYLSFPSLTGSLPPNLSFEFLLGRSSIFSLKLFCPFPEY